MTIKKTASGKYSVSIRWGMYDKGFGTYDTKEEAQKVHDQKMSERPPTIPNKGAFDRSIDKFNLLNTLWIPTKLRI